MKKIKIYARATSQIIIFSIFLFMSCTKVGNPNGLPETIPPSEYQGKNDGIIKVLAIGNSFSEDAIESHLYELAKATGDSIVIGNLYIGGASLDLHVDNAAKNASIYSYRKIKNGAKKIYPNISIATAIGDEYWDYISFQQVSQESGIFSTFEKTLPVLYNYVKGKALNPNVKYLLHQTWAYAQNSTHAGFVNYDKDQMKMYKAIVGAYNQAKTLINAEKIVPSGTAIQNARTSVVGDNFTRDGYHLSIPFGRYVAAATWYESIFGKSPVGNTYKPSELSQFETNIAQNAAHYAMQNPNVVTEMVNFQGTGDFTGSILINFGTAAAPAGWNGVTAFREETSVSLKNNTNNYTGIRLTITEKFNGANTSGESSTTTDFNMPSAVSASAFFGNSKAEFGGVLVKQSKLKISGLDKNMKYNFCYFGSRNQSTDNRETKFITTGKNEVAVLQNSSNNKSVISCANAVQPNDNGEVTITITAGENNNNSTGFYYINAMRITK
ncbi:DUF4886 domain-containing protein [Haoranjiania flava]|uniref:DUF4886 domain-containing protein n=1 Tax=Haoranjiania flava TaxID=1856322 RepID=A0AAE3LJH9_9BACT|nr:DUF4886 domain-containing protein [Haoranjiania flava]MCU7693762.1 DUF4886 domain-containing protein [Haoranjiania flava]